MKKQTQKSVKTASVRVHTTCCTTRQKLLGIVALGGLFACGIMVGINMNMGASKQTTPAASANDERQTCQVIEDMMLQWLRPEDSDDIGAHQYNMETYNKLIVNGCPENVEKYQALLQREQDILAALTGNIVGGETQTCEEIETLLTQNMPWGGANSADRIIRAKIYANLSERGCAENSEKYVELAKQELQIARALEDDKFDETETIEVVETYKRLNMQMAAQEILDKVKKLTDPAIDFIIRVENIINE